MEIIKEVFRKLKNNKIILIILITGVIFLFIPANESEEKSYDVSYEKNLKEEAEAILGKIEGAGKVSLMISFSDKGRAIPVTDKNESGDILNEKTVSVSGKVALLKEEYPSVRGAIVVCEGGGNERVRENIINAVAAITGAPVHSIKVYKMEE